MGRITRLIDMHLHLKENLNEVEALKDLDKEMQQNDIEEGLLLHLNIHEHNVEKLGRELKNYPNIHCFVNINPCLDDAKETLKKAILEEGYKGLKLHPRLNRYQAGNQTVIELVKYAGELNVPVLIDAFPDGYSILDGFSAQQYAVLANSAPEVKIIIAHFGGHHIIDFMWVAKRFPNVYLNFAYSLLYYRECNVIEDLFYAMKNLKYEKVFYGSDYPDRDMRKTIDMSLCEFEKRNISEEIINKIFFENGKRFLQTYIGREG